MQDSGYGYPPVEDRSQRLPLLLCALAATNQNVSPEPIDALSESVQLTDIPGNSMVLVVASDHLPKPCTNLTDAIMLPAEKLNLNGLELCNHSRFRSNSPDGEGVGLVASPAVVGEAQEREGLWFPFAPLFPVVGCKTPEFDQREISTQIASGRRAKPFRSDQTVGGTIIQFQAAAPPRATLIARCGACLRLLQSLVKAKQKNLHPETECRRR